jgi:hypothetical protein
MNQVVFLGPQIPQTIQGIPRVPTGTEPTLAQVRGFNYLNSITFLDFKSLPSIFGDSQERHPVAPAHQMAPPMEAAKKGPLPGNIMV